LPKQQGSDMRYILMTPLNCLTSQTPFLVQESRLKYISWNLLNFDILVTDAVITTLTAYRHTQTIAVALLQKSYQQMIDIGHRTRARKQRLSPKTAMSQRSATVAEFGDCRRCLAVFGDSRTFLRQCRQALRRTWREQRLIWMEPVSRRKFIVYWRGYLRPLR